MAVQAVRLASRLCTLVAPWTGPGSIPGAHASAIPTAIKADASPVTVADFGAQAVVASLLATHFPDDPLVGEEDASELRRGGGLRSQVSASSGQEGEASASPLAARIQELVNAVLPKPADPLSLEQVLAAIDRGGASGSDGRRFWTLDPIDGTKGFLRGGQYAVCLALVDAAGVVQLGLLGCPNLPHPSLGADSTKRGVLFLAQRGHGAYQAPLFPEHEGEVQEAGWTPVPTTTPVTKVEEASFCESVEAGHSAQGEAAEVARLLGITRPSTRMDSQCKYGILARGEVQLYLRLPLPPAPGGRTYVECIWDHAAGSVLVEEAGGRVTDMHGAPLDFTQGRKLLRNRGVVAASSADLHDKVLGAIRQLHPPPGM